MNDRARRKELTAQYKQTHPEAGVYRIVNRQNGKALLGSTTNLASLHNKVQFARETNTPGTLDGRLRADVIRFGLDAFELEILEVLQPEPETTTAQLQEDLATLEALWREKMDPALLY
ncbi:MAG: GIY-YIG nuclease family protein [Chloroflexota bacterium]